MKYVRKTAEYSWTDYKTNAEIAKEPDIIQVLDKIPGCRRNWLQHINRVSRNRLPVTGRLLENSYMDII
jgi:hypothetical protein